MSAAILNLVSFSLFAHRDSDKPEKINISLLSGFCGFAYEHCVAMKSGDKNNVPGVRGFGVWGRRSVFGGWVSRHPKKSCVISENFLGQIEQNFSIDCTSVGKDEPHLCSLAIFQWLRGFRIANIEANRTLLRWHREFLYSKQVYQGGIFIGTRRFLDEFRRDGKVWRSISKNTRRHLSGVGFPTRCDRGQKN